VKAAPSFSFALDLHAGWRQRRRKRERLLWRPLLVSAGALGKREWREVRVAPLKSGDRKANFTADDTDHTDLHRSAPVGAEETHLSRSTINGSSICIEPMQMAR